jgi:hypothetical protein
MDLVDLVLSLFELLRDSGGLYTRFLGVNQHMTKKFIVDPAQQFFSLKACTSITFKQAVY